MTQTLTQIFLLATAVAGGAVFDNAVQEAQDFESLDLQSVLNLIIGPFGALIILAIATYKFWKKTQKQEEDIKKSNEEKEQLLKDRIKHLEEKVK